ncbi:ABC transporter ATP-binding protein [uncultured Fretibacterium sp.]|uniref:ABC transporter ATP-binding protein n=1 Tax=uncultured Fretibacterium sp. TaxID=1678694 RepID=UPI002637664A|nr:ABC transporter ATP-binding protein [uncultured Fretibacterium sp.]
MEKLIEIKDLAIHYETDDGVVKALNSVSLSLVKGRTLGVVGETGAGKTTLGKGILRLIPSPPGRIVSGSVLFEGQDLLKLSEAEMRKIRGRSISMIFQDPMTSLNPVMTVGDQIMEVIQAHKNLHRQEAWQEACRILEMVGIPGQRGREYPHQFSGGMRQRVGIAIALACAPTLLIADEPTTALDVTIQAQVLEMIRDLKKALGTSVILITHDLGVVAHNCDYVAIIYAGTLMEYGALREIFKSPQHPYTIGLFGSIPSLERKADRLRPIPGLMPDPTNLPPGCPFAERCPHSAEVCSREVPALVQLGGEHAVRCVLARGRVSHDR